MGSIKKLCYELYKTDWKHRHITNNRKIQSIKEYYKDLIECESEYSYEDYIEEFGYDGELYACYGEFLGAEFLDEEYMCTLLEDNLLITQYLKDVKEFIKGV